MIINQYYQLLRARFSRETNDVSALDLRLLIQAGASITAEEFISGGDSPLSEQQIEIIEQFVSRRMAGEPASKIIGVREFWGRAFMVTKDTLDPRADTEILIERALLAAQEKEGKSQPLRIADIGTGTGCILITLLLELPLATGVAVDISPAALAVARENAARHGVSDRISFRQASYLDGMEGGEIDILVSNPPYIPESDIPNLAINVRNHDPILALSGGADGLEAYKVLITETKNVLKFDGCALFEIGYGQLPDILRLVDDSTATLKAVTPDMAGIPRVVEISYGDNKINV